jgi:CCR4-NOT transcription complex subunit 6
MISVFRMSRSIKEKYENTNPRRNHSIMSQEEVAAGKKTNWTELEITGNINL